MSDNTENNVPLTDGEVTAHTASLWRYTPVPEAPEPFPEYKELYEKYSDYSVTAARVRGKKHKHDGSNCDDWFEVSEIGGWIIGAVSDGAGSKRFSRIGARAACTSFVNEVRDNFLAAGQTEGLSEKLSLPLDNPDFISACTKLTEIMQTAFIHACEAVEQEFESRKNNPEFTAEGELKLSDFSCTLVTCSVIPLDNGEQLSIAIQAGDGMVCSVSPHEPYSSALTLLGIPDSGDFSGETEFLTSAKIRTPAAVQSRTKLRRSKRSAVMLMSDGVADDYFPNSPKMLNLYLDLMMNGIIPKPSGETSSEIVPDIQPNSWVNDKDVSYAIAYSEGTAEKSGISMEKLWDMKANLPDPPKSEENLSELSGNAAEKLCRWLDVYLKRGSFDDRTLMVILPEKAGDANG